MIGRIVEVADDQRHLFLNRGFLVVQESSGERKELGQIPLDDIAAVIANAHGLSYTNNLLVALAERAAPFVLCAANHNAVGMLLSIEGNYEQARRIDAQIDATLPLRKRLWASIVKAKLEQQGAVLEAIGLAPAPIAKLVLKVRSGDPENVEAQAARRYWRLLFGDSFRRDRSAGGINGLLNYGYTILRAATARAVIASGLHPSVALHHSNGGNAMRLVDDLMEPFRPVIDLRVKLLHERGKDEIDRDSKRGLVGTMYEEMQTDAGATPVMVCLQRLAVSLGQVFLGEREKLDLPLRDLPLALARGLPD